MFQVAFVEDQIRKDGSIVSRVVQRDNVSFDDMLDYMSKGAVVSEADMKAVLSQFSDALVYFLAKGSRVQTPLGSFTVNLRRTGEDSTERTISADALTIRVRPATEIAEELKRSIQISVVDTPSTPVPLIYGVENIDDKTIVNGGKPGQILHLTGSRLSFDLEDGESGVFFAADDGKETRSQVYSRVGNVYIDCKIPDIPAGAYTLVVRTKPGKTTRSGNHKNRIRIS
jgi:nucleoid DNA-binding protein